MPKKNVCYLVFGNGTWGKGATIEEAKFQYRKHGGRRPGSAMIWQFPADANPRIDNIGGLWTEYPVDPVRIDSRTGRQLPKGE